MGTISLGAGSVEVVDRIPLTGGDGLSGSALARLVLADGRVLIEKRVSPTLDWIMRATHDAGRAATLWTTGVLDSVPEVIDHTVVGAEPDGDGWLVFMRDASDALVPEGRVLTRAESSAILAAATELHERFLGERLPGLCSLADRYATLSPATGQREAGGPNTIPNQLGRGWERFAEGVAADVAGAVLAILDRPWLLADELESCDCTLLHGDLKMGNLGIAGERVVMLDWGNWTGFAPPAVEFAWYLAVNWSRIAASREQLVEDFRRHAGKRHDERALRLALIGGLVQLGWNKALDAAEHPDPATRAREAADLDWWVARARQGLELWSPL